MKKQNKILWLSALQGWSILLVVIGHIVLSNNIYNNTFILDRINQETYYILKSFRMHLFVFISGFLFYITHIRKEKLYKETLIAKFKRLGVPFLFFTGFAILLKYAFNPMMKRQIDFSWRLITDSLYLTGGGNPLLELWFVFTLFVLFLFYPLYKISLQNTKYIALFVIFASLLNLFFPDGVAFLCLSQVAKYMIFFYAGIITSKYEFYKILDSWLIFAASIVVFAFAWIVEAPKIITAFVGISSSFSTFLCIAHKFPNLFSSYRNYTYQIYLIGIFPQIAVRFLYVKIVDAIQYNAMLHGIIYIILYITSILVALYIPVFIAKIVEKIPYKWIRMCFGLS